MMRTQPRVHVEAAALLDWGFAALAAGTQPVGTLVAPLEPEGPAPAAESAVLRRSLVPEDGADDGAGLSLQWLTVAGLLAAVLLVRRRRQVVLARSARRAAARTAARPGPRPSGPGAARPAPPRQRSAPRSDEPASRPVAGASRGGGRPVPGPERRPVPRR